MFSKIATTTQEQEQFLEVEFLQRLTHNSCFRMLERPP
jgi:hypothetical protein